MTQAKKSQARKGHKEHKLERRMLEIHQIKGDSSQKMTNARQTRKGHKLERHKIELHELEWDTVYKKTQCTSI